MKKELIIVGLVGALAIPTAAIAAGHGSNHKSKGHSAASAPRTQAKGSAPRSGLAIRLKPTKNVPLGAKTRTSAKPKAGTRAGRKPNAGASAARTRTPVRAKRNKTAGTPGVGVSLNQRKGAKVSGKKGIGGLALPISLDGLSGLSV